MNMAQSRRKFINFLLSTSLGGWLLSVLYPIVSYLKPPEIPEANVNSVKAGTADTFAANSASIVKFGRQPVILIRMDTGEFRAFNATCTHLDCIVQYKTDTKQIWCACHNGIYDLTGRNISGPPPKPLEEYAVKILNNEIIVSQV
jgi:Rieske Fe-S protein